VTIWDQILDAIRVSLPDEDFRRWFGTTAYASDSGDQITVWVPTENIRRHLVNHYQDHIDRALKSVGRPYTNVRLVVGGTDEDEDTEDPSATS
jgi:chromosomal replication initiation ATPase DnaA